MAVTVLVADDHEIVRKGISILLRDVPDVEVIAAVADGQAAIEKTVLLQPDVVLMDIRMLEGDGLTALEAIREQCPDMPVVMHSMHDNPTFVARSIALGATDYVLKGAPIDEIGAAIRRAAAKQAPPEGSLYQRIRDLMSLRDEKDQQVADQLTRRECQVLRHLALGLSNREIGRSMFISVETVKEHVQNVLRKIEAIDRTQAAVWAVKQGIVS